MTRDDVMAAHPPGEQDRGHPGTRPPRELVRHDDRVRGGSGFTDYPGASMLMRVTGQNDRVFAGEFIFTHQSGLVTTVEFGGVVGRDGRTLTIVERNGGYSFGTIIAPDEIELIHADDSDPLDIAIDSLKKI